MEEKSPPSLISVVIVSYNTREMTLKCLEALFTSLTAIPAEVWLVDNASTDGTVADVQRHFPQVRVIANDRNVGFGTANNQAMRQASGKYILLLNTDAFVQPTTLSTLAEYLDNHPDIAAIGPRLLNADGSLQHSCYRFPSPSRTMFENLLLTAAFPNNSLVGDLRNWPHDVERDVDFVIGACLLLRYSVLKTIGLFDEGFFMYAEETDLFYRLKTSGWRTVFVPTAECTHLGGGSGKEQSARVFCEFRRGQEKFFRKHYGLLGLIWYRVWMTFGALLRIVLFGMFALLRPSQKSSATREVRNWSRILTWTLGRRGPGLREAAQQAMAQPA
jgi:GT2 family glycosyltransferase